MALETRSEYKLPLPPMRGPAADFYKFCKAHELRFQRCAECGTWRHIPRDVCAKCGSFKFEWARSSGKGKVFSWTVTAQPFLPQFAPMVPYAPVIIEMDEGVRMLSWLTDVKPEDLQLGMRVAVVFDDVTPEVTLPKFKRAVSQ
jgi:uncharacterized OB-fold protein